MSQRPLCQNGECREPAAVYHIRTGLMYCKDHAAGFQGDPSAEVDVFVHKTWCDQLNCSKPARWISKNGTGQFCENHVTFYSPPIQFDACDGEQVKIAVAVDIRASDEQLNIIGLVEIAGSLGWAGYAVTGVSWKDQEHKLLHLQIEQASRNAALDRSNHWRDLQKRTKDDLDQALNIIKGRDSTITLLMENSRRVLEERDQARLELGHVLGEMKQDTVLPVPLELDFGGDRE